MRPGSAPAPLTNDDEGVVHVGAAEAVGGFADVGPRVLTLHLLDFQPLLEDPEPGPAAVDRPPVLHPHGEGWGVAFHRAQELDGPAQPHGLAVNHLIGDPRGAWGRAEAGTAVTNSASDTALIQN